MTKIWISKSSHIHNNPVCTFPNGLLSSFPQNGGKIRSVFAHAWTPVPPSSFFLPLGKNGNEVRVSEMKIHLSNVRLIAQNVPNHVRRNCLCMAGLSSKAELWAEIWAENFRHESIWIRSSRCRNDQESTEDSRAPLPSPLSKIIKKTFCTFDQPTQFSCSNILE